MEFSGKIGLMIILTVTKKQCFALYLEDTFFEKPQEKGGRGRVKTDLLLPFYG